MKHSTQNSLATQYSQAALGTIASLQIVMLASLLAQLPPHPPLTTPLFALGPFLAASISIALAALILGVGNTKAGTIVSIIAALLALVSFGPQKWADAAISQIWPAVLLGQIAAAVIFVCAFKALRHSEAAT